MSVQVDQYHGVNPLEKRLLCEFTEIFPAPFLEEVADVPGFDLISMRDT